MSGLRAPTRTLALAVALLVGALLLAGGSGAWAHRETGLIDAEVSSADPRDQFAVRAMRMTPLLQVQVWALRGSVLPLVFGCALLGASLGRRRAS